MADGWICGTCAAGNPAGFRFCGQCGSAATTATTAADAPAVVASSNREERRQITVLFSDASGYTTMAEQLDPEVVREVMGRVYARAEAVAL